MRTDSILSSLSWLFSYLGGYEEQGSHLEAFPEVLYPDLFDRIGFSAMKRFAQTSKLNSHLMLEWMHIRGNITEKCGLEGLKFVSPVKARFADSLKGREKWSSVQEFQLSQASEECIKFIAPRWEMFPFVSDVSVSLDYTTESVLETFVEYFPIISKNHKFRRISIISEDASFYSDFYCKILNVMEDIGQLKEFSIYLPFDDESTDALPCLQKFLSNVAVESLEIEGIMYHHLSIEQVENTISLSELKRKGLKALNISAYETIYIPSNMSEYILENFVAFKHSSFLNLGETSAQFPNIRELSASPDPSLADLLENPNVARNLESLDLAVSSHMTTFFPHILARKHQLKKLSFARFFRESFPIQLDEYLSDNSVLQELSLFVNKDFESNFLIGRQLKKLSITMYPPADSFNFTFIHDLSLVLSNPALESLSWSIYSNKNPKYCAAMYLNIYQDLLDAALSNPSMKSLSIKMNCGSTEYLPAPTKEYVQFLKRLVKMTDFFMKQHKLGDRDFKVNGIDIQEFILEMSFEYKYWPKESLFHVFAI